MSSRQLRRELFEHILRRVYNLTDGVHRFVCFFSELGLVVNHSFADSAHSHSRYHSARDTLDNVHCAFSHTITSKIVLAILLFPIKI